MVKLKIMLVIIDGTGKWGFELYRREERELRDTLEFYNLVDWEVKWADGA